MFSLADSNFYYLSFFMNMGPVCLKMLALLTGMWDKHTTVKSFNFVGMKFGSLTILDIFVDTFGSNYMQYYYLKENKYFGGILNSWIALVTHEIHKIKCPMNINGFTIFLLPVFYHWLRLSACIFLEYFELCKQNFGEMKRDIVIYKSRWNTF